MSERFYQDKDLREWREQIVPMRRIGAPKDIAVAKCVLGGDRASYINGQGLIVDGGVMTILATRILRPGYRA